MHSAKVGGEVASAYDFDACWIDSVRNRMGKSRFTMSLQNEAPIAEQFAARSTMAAAISSSAATTLMQSDNVASPVPMIIAEEESISFFSVTPE